MFDHFWHLALGALVIHGSYYLLYTICGVLCISAEQYTGFVVIPQYWFLIPSNFLNTIVPL